MKSKTGGERRQILFGGVISYILIALNILLGLIYTPWILRTIGDSQYGLYTLASSLIALFLMDFGMSSACTRFLAAYRAKNNAESISEIYTVVIKLYLAIMVIVSVILAVVFINIGSIYRNLTAEELYIFKRAFLITAFSVVICFPVNVFNGVLNAFEKYIALKLTDVINRLGTVILTIVALSCGGGIYWLIAISGVANIITLIVKIAVVKRKTSVKYLPGYFEKERFREIATFSIWSTVGSVSQQMIFNVMPTILAMTLDTFAITMYGFANVMEGYVSTITGAINGLFLPKISRTVVDRDDAANVYPLMLNVGRLNQSIIMLLLIGWFITGKQFITLWIGEKYITVYYCVLLLMLPYCISSSLQIANSSVIALNKIKYTSIIQVVTGIGNLVLAYLIAPSQGVLGVCCCISFTYFLRSFLNIVVYIRKLKIDIPHFLRDCQGKMLPAFVISGFLSFGAYKYGLSVIPALGGWIGFAISACAVAIIYVGVMWIAGWNASEKRMVLSLVCKC